MKDIRQGVVVIGTPEQIALIRKLGEVVGPGLIVNDWTPVDNMLAQIAEWKKANDSTV